MCKENVEGHGLAKQKFSDTKIHFWFDMKMLLPHNETWPLAFLHQCLLWWAGSVHCLFAQYTAIPWEFPKQQSLGQGYLLSPRLELEEKQYPSWPDKIFPVLPCSGQWTYWPAIFSVAGSSHCHFPPFGNTAYIKLAFENVKKAFLWSVSFLLCSHFLGGTVRAPLGTLSIS